MKTTAIKKLRRKLAADQPVYGLWITLESASIAEMAVALGLDWIVIDAEHGHLDWKEIVEHVRATVRSDTVVLVRIAELSIGLIKRALDIGADGVVVPWVESAEQLSQAVAFAHYPPEGVRGIGAERATCWGQCFVEHTQEANEHVLVVPIIESVQGGRNVQSMLSVSGVDLFFFGPADYSSSAGYRGQWEGPGVAEQILAAKDAIRAAGKHCGVIATGNENLLERRKQGFQMLGLGLDGGLLLRSLHGALAAVGRDRRIVAAFQPESESPPAVPAECPPESLRPDRGEVITPLGKGEKSDIGRPGVPGAPSTLEYLVGKFNGARNLTTAIVNLAPGMQVDYHTHVYTEAVTVLEGALLMEVEGRQYRLGPLDNLVIPAGLAHRARNPSTMKPAVLHGALATDTPGRTPVDKFFSVRAMPDGATGHEGAEYVTRQRTAKRFRAGRERELHRLLQRESRAGHRDERRLRPVPARWTIAGPRTRLRRVDLHRARRGDLHRGRAAVHAFRLRYGLAAPRPSALFHQRIESAHGHDLGLRRPPAGTNGRGPTVRNGGRQPLEIGP